MSGVKGIGSFGAVALLVSSMTVSITIHVFFGSYMFGGSYLTFVIVLSLFLLYQKGPGLSTIPAMFQQVKFIIFLFLLMFYVSLFSFTILAIVVAIFF